MATSTKEMLQARSLAIFNAINNRSWDDPAFDHMDPDISSHVEGALISATLENKEELIQFVRHLADKVPAYELVIMDCSCKASDKTGKGTVWFLRTLRGIEDGLVCESVTVWPQRRLIIEDILILLRVTLGDGMGEEGGRVS
jgi:hypothetical protein